jgi:hypothetical protein
VVGKKQPALTTSATQTVTIGGPISDAATLTNATSDALGTITFRLFNASNCVSCREVTTTLSAVSVSGPGTYNSGNVTPAAAGTYYWTASYSGDSKNLSVSTWCNYANELSLVVKASATVATAQTVAPQDSATVSAGAGGTPTGNVTFALSG